MTRTASTLLELTMALAIMAVCLFAVMESTVQVSFFANNQARQGDLESQARSITRHLMNDLSNTAWFVVYDPAIGQSTRLFPKIVHGAPEDYGDELVFLRLRSEHSIGNEPGKNQVSAVNFNDEPPLPMARYARAKPIASLVLNPQWDKSLPEKPFTATVWENSSGQLSYSDAHDIDNLRHYRYVVHSDLTVTGRGVLFREYRNGSTGEWISDRRIADNIDQISFSTNKQEPWLSANQILVSIDLRADDLTTGKLQAKRHIELTIAMRSIVEESTRELK